MRYAFCCVSISPIRKEKSDSSEMVSQLLFGEVVEVVETQNNWVKITNYSDAYSGWVDEKQLLYLSEKEIKRWLEGKQILQSLILEIEGPLGRQIITKGALIPSEKETTFNIGAYTYCYIESPDLKKLSLSDFAKSYLSTPYLWGGKSPFGIDCSGFTQQVFKAIDINLPRDAYQQAELGMEINFEDKVEGDLAFFQNESGKITHVGIVLSGNKIIHASGYVRIDLLRQDGIYHEKSLQRTHQLAIIKRY